MAKAIGSSKKSRQTRTDVYAPGRLQDGMPVASSILGAGAGGGGGGGVDARLDAIEAALATAEFLVSAATAALGAERVTTDTPTIAWDHATPAQAKANIPDKAVTFAKIQDLAADRLAGRGNGGGAGSLQAISLDATLAFVGTVLGVVGGTGAPAAAEYVVAAAHAGLSAERVTTDTPTVAWDHGTAAQAKANVPDSAITTAKLNNLAVTTAKIDGQAVTFQKMQALGSFTKGVLMGLRSLSNSIPEEIEVHDGLEISSLQLKVSAAGISNAMAGFTWTAVSFNAGDFTAVGGGSWTVAAGDVSAFQYLKLGRLMLIMFTLDTTSVAATANELNILIPGGFTNSKLTEQQVFALDNLVSLPTCRALVDASGTQIRLLKNNSAAWTASTNQTYIRGLLAIETTT